MVMIDQKQFLVLAVDLSNQSSLDALLVLATGADKRQEFLVFDLEDRSGDLCRFQRFKLELLFLTTGCDNDFDRLDFVSTADEFLKVSRQGLFVFVVGPFKVGRRAGIKVGDVPSIWAVFRMIVASMLILFT